MDYLLILSVTLLQTIPLVGIFLYIFRDNLKIKPWLCIVGGILSQVIFVFLARGTIDVLDTNPFSKFFSALISAVVQWLIISLITNLSMTQNLFVILVMHSIVDDVMLSVLMIYRGRVTTEQVLQWKYVGLVALYILLYTPMFYLLLKRGVQPLLAVTRDYVVWNYMWLLPLFVFVVFRIRICPDYFNQGFGWHSSLWALPYVWTFGTLGVFYFVVRSLRMTYERDRAEMELEVAELMSGAHAKQYAALQEQMENDRRSRHDFRHSLLMIRQYAQEGQCDNILENIQEYIDDTVVNKGQMFCENITLNTVLKYFVGQAERESIRTDVKAVVPEGLKLTETELSILVGNLMENALEACRRQTEGERFIRARFEKREKQMFTISLQNSYSGDIVEDKGRYMSSKRNEYGIGLSSISYIVEQYEGVMKVRHEKGVFTVNVMINC